MVEVHRNSLPDEEQRSDQRAGQKNPKQAAREIDPEVPKRCAGLPRQASNKGNADGQSRGSSEKILRAEPHHLTEIAHGVFASVSLPCGGSCEADGSIDRQVRRERRRLILREKPGKEALEAKNGVKEESADQTEDNEGNQV